MNISGLLPWSTYVVKANVVEVVTGVGQNSVGQFQWTAACVVHCGRCVTSFLFLSWGYPSKQTWFDAPATFGQLHKLLGNGFVHCLFVKEWMFYWAHEFDSF